jgi:predicted phage terminase large subunit-like protein
VTPALFAITASRGRWQAAPHLLMLSDKLTQVAAGSLKRLMVFMPPRSGKSQLCSQYFPAWYLGHHPDNRVILTSYESDFAASWGWKVRNVFEEFAPEIFGLHIRSDSSARNRWDIADHVGGMNTAGVGAAITGKGGNLIIIDDPCKNAEDANSELKQDKTFDWYQSTLYTRLEPKGAIILIMTRWGTNDLGGWLLREMEAGGEQWDILKFPAIAEEHDILGRSPGDPLWKKRYPIDALKRIEGTVSAYWWAAMYQQSPYSRTGGTFKRQDFIITETGAKGDQVRFWDLAATEAKQGKDPDWTVGCLMSEQGGKYWIKDIIRVQEEAAEVERIIKQAARMDGKETKIYMEQEGGASGKSLISYYARNILKGYAFEGVSPTGSKPVRAQPFAAAVANGNVYLMAAAWNSSFLDEAERFPTAKVHDDQCDSASQAFNLLFIEDITITDPLPVSIGGYNRER